MTERALRSIASSVTVDNFMGSPTGLATGSPVAAPEPHQRKPRAPRQSPEARIVAAITRDLTRLGYQVARVGQGIAKASGTTVGYPDLSVRRTGWPRALACLMEAKAQKGRMTPEQQALCDNGWSYVVRSSQDALRALYVTECALGELAAAQKLADVLKQADPAWSGLEEK